jgi:hypothetical protein
MAVSGVADPQGGRPVANSDPLGHPTPYAWEKHYVTEGRKLMPANRTSTGENQRRKIKLPWGKLKSANRTSSAKKMPADRTGEFHDQGDAKWIAFGRQLRGHNETLFGRPTPGLAALWAYLVVSVTIN